MGEKTLETLKQVYIEAANAEAGLVAVRAHVLEEAAKRLGRDDIKRAIRQIIADEECHPLVAQVRAIIETVQSAIRALAKEGGE